MSAVSADSSEVPISDEDLGGMLVDWLEKVDSKKVDSYAGGIDLSEAWDDLFDDTRGSVQETLSVDPLVAQISAYFDSLSCLEDINHLTVFLELLTECEGIVLSRLGSFFEEYFGSILRTKFGLSDLSCCVDCCSDGRLVFAVSSSEVDELSEAVLREDFKGDVSVCDSRLLLSLSADDFVQILSSEICEDPKLLLIKFGHRLLFESSSGVVVDDGICEIVQGIDEFLLLDLVPAFDRLLSKIFAKFLDNLEVKMKLSRCFFPGAAVISCVGSVDGLNCCISFKPVEGELCCSSLSALASKGVLSFEVISGTDEVEVYAHASKLSQLLKN